VHAFKYLRRLKAKWQATLACQASQTPATSGNPASESSEGIAGAEEGQENQNEETQETEERPLLIREPWEQAALAFLGKPGNTQLTSLVEADFALPEEWCEKLSPNGKVSRLIGHSGRIKARRVSTGSNGARMPEVTTR
jgi:hypothetical protein